MIDGVTTSGALPVLERMMQFAGARHRLISNNLANLSTPGFRPEDVSVSAFQQSLRDAIDARKAGDRAGGLALTDSREVVVHRDGLELRPQPRGDNILFHDGNDRDLERLMQSLVENIMAFRAASQLLRNRQLVLNEAIRERI